MIKTVLFVIGNAESRRIASCIESHDIGFETATEALASIGNALFEAYKVSTNPYRDRECCGPGKEVPTTYCPECGRYVGKENRNVCDAVLWYYDGTCDSSGEGWDYLVNAGWDGNLIWAKGNVFEDPSTVLLVQDDAENVIHTCTTGEKTRFFGLDARMLDGSKVPW